MLESPQRHTRLTYNKLDKLYLRITYCLYISALGTHAGQKFDLLLLFRESHWGIWACLPLAGNGDWFGRLNELLAPVFIAFIKI